MIQSLTTERFRKALDSLPESVQRQAKVAYHQFKANPSHPSLRFKRVHSQQPIYSARVNRHYRALCVKEGDVLIWFWIGNHDGYEQLLKQL